MAADPLDEMRATLARRSRWFTVAHAVLVVVAVGVFGWFAFVSQSSSFLLGFIFLAIVMPAGVPLIWWMNRRGWSRIMAAFEAFRPRVVGARASPTVGFFLLLENGLVVAVDPRSGAVRFVAFFSPGGALIRPDMAQVVRWGSRIRGLQSEGAISKSKGPAEAQAELERFRVAFGAKWYLCFLREVKSDRLAAGEPMWHEVLVFFIPRLWEQTPTIAAQLDAVTGFMERARTLYFPRGAKTA